MGYSDLLEAVFPLISLSHLIIMVAVDTVAPHHAVSLPQPLSKGHVVGVDHLMEGKRYMLVKDYPSAAESLAQACHYLASKHGETAPECADAYFHYGKALLEMGRMEAGVLGNALDGLPEDEDESSAHIESTEKMTEEEKEEVGMKVMEALEENFETHEEKINQLVYGHTKNDFDDVEEDEDEDDMEESEESHHDDVMDTDKPSEVEEDPSNLERAWEMLELAKNIYSKMTSNHSEPSSQAENTRKLCDTLLALGEVSIESENYSQAVEDLSSCLEKRKDKLPKEMREIAETQYQLGVALGYHCQFDEAVKYFNDAKKVLGSMLDNLKSDTFSARVGEIDDLESLLPQIQEKIQDTMDSKDETSQSKKMRCDDSGFSASDKPASSIEPRRK